METRLPSINTEDIVNIKQYCLNESKANEQIKIDDRCNLKDVVVTFEVRLAQTKFQRRNFVPQKWESVLIRQ